MDLQRYQRQIAFAPIGAQGQRQIARGRVAVVGCGALGATISVMLARVGVGSLTIVDRDVVALSNLPRQALFDEQDVRLNLPKAFAARRKLLAINSAIQIDAQVTDVHHANVGNVIGTPDVILDGMDNFETRMLVNDYAVSTGVPWIYGAVLGATGLAMSVFPHETPCLRCLFPEPLAPGTAETTETVGIIAPIIHVIAAFEVTETIKCLMGKRSEMAKGLFSADIWHHEFRMMDISGVREAADCPCCKQGDFPWLEGRRDAESAFRSASNVVLIRPEHPAHVDLDALAEALAGQGPVERNEFLVTWSTPSATITVFGDGRAMVEGVADLEDAKALYRRYVDA